MTPDDLARIKSRIPLRLSDSADADELVREVERLQKDCDVLHRDDKARLDAALIQVESTRKQSSANFDGMVKAEKERDAALAALRIAAEEARALRVVLHPEQRLEVALPAVDRYNALLSALANRDGMTEIEKARRDVVASALAVVVERRKLMRLMGAAQGWDDQQAVAQASVKFLEDDINALLKLEGGA